MWLPFIVVFEDKREVVSHVTFYINIFCYITERNRRRQTAWKQMENGISGYLAPAQNISRFRADDDDDVASVHGVGKQVSHV
jgi:hypothetical protein